MPQGSGGGLVVVRDGIGYFEGQLRSQGASRPTGSGVTGGHLHYDTANGVLEHYDGTTWHTIAKNLADLEDVNISGVLEGDFITWNAATSKWDNSRLADFSVFGKPDSSTNPTSIVLADDELLGKKATGGALTGQSPSNARSILAIDPAAKGDIVSASAAMTPSIVTVGANYTQPVADSTQTAGWTWVAQHPVIALKGASHTNITTATDLTWTTSSLKDTAGFTHSTSTNPAEITIVRGMICRVVYTISGTVVTAGVAHTAIHVNTGGGFGLLDNANCYASMPTVSGRFTITYDHVHQFAASDIIKVVGNIVSAGKWNFRADESRICLEEIRRV